MKKMIISIMCLCLLSCSSGQFDVFINNFKTISLPFLIIDETFDRTAVREDLYVISEEDVVKYLMMENDTFVNIKESSVRTGYPKYMAVGKFNVYDDFLGVLYFRTIDREDGNIILELMLCVFTKKGKLISTYPISGTYTAEKLKFFSTIFSAENIEISFYQMETHEDRFGIYYTTSEEVFETKNLYISKEGLIQQR